MNTRKPLKQETMKNSETKLYQSPSELIDFWKASDSEEHIAEANAVVYRHVLMCLIGEGFSGGEAHPTFNIDYICQTIAHTGAALNEIGAIIGFLHNTKPRKEDVPKWDLLFNCIKAEMSRQGTCLDAAWHDILAGLEN